MDAGGIEKRVRERFANAAEGDAYIEQRIRDLVKPNDNLWFLGDITMFRENHMAHEFVALIKSLPGKKSLIPGNHDHLNTRHYVDAGLKIRGARLHDGVLLTHYPVHPSSLGPRVIGNAHGHTHQNPDLSPQYLNICVERTGYEPVPIEWAQERLKNKQFIAELAKEPILDAQGNMVTGP